MEAPGNESDLRGAAHSGCRLCRASRHCNRSLNEAVRVRAPAKKTPLPAWQVVTALAFAELAILHDCRREVDYMGTGSGRASRHMKCGHRPEPPAQASHEARAGSAPPNEGVQSWRHDETPHALQITPIQPLSPTQSSCPRCASTVHPTCSRRHWRHRLKLCSPCCTTSARSRTRRHRPAGSCSDKGRSRVQLRVWPAPRDPVGGGLPPSGQTVHRADLGRHRREWRGLYSDPERRVPGP